MLWQHSLAVVPPKPIVLDDDPGPFKGLLLHLGGERLALSNLGLTDLIALFRCAHKYQYYSLGVHILRDLDQYRSPQNVLHIYIVLQPLPELPDSCDLTAPSAPLEETALHEIDPEQAEFSALLQRTFRRCLEVIDTQSREVLASDALLSMSLPQLEELAQRDTLQAREFDIGRALLRWLRHRSLCSRLLPDQRRLLVLTGLRLLTMSAKELKKLELEREGVLTREELEAVLRHAHHGAAALPPALQPYREYWMCPRAGSRGSRGLLKRLMERTRVGYGSAGGDDEVDTAERREASLQRRSRRADKVKMALATGASFIFD